MKKCEWNGNEMIPCDNLNSVVHGTNGDAKGLTFRHVSNLNNGAISYHNGVILKHGNSKKEMVVISFCPACGENIEPRYNKG